MVEIPPYEPGELFVGVKPLGLDSVLAVFRLIVLELLFREVLIICAGHWVHHPCTTGRISRENNSMLFLTVSKGSLVPELNRPITCL